MERAARETSRSRKRKRIRRRAQKGDEHAFECLVRRYQKWVFGLATRILQPPDDAEDVAQRVFLKVYLSLNRFDQQAPFSTWLYKITLNECRDHMRKKKVRPLVYVSDLSEMESFHINSTATPNYSLATQERRVGARQLLEQVLSALPKHDRELLLLKEIEGFSIRELSEILGLNINTVKLRLFRARGRMIRAHRELSAASAATQVALTA